MHAWSAVGIDVHTSFALCAAKKKKKWQGWVKRQKLEPFSLLIFSLVKIRLGHAPDFVSPPQIKMKRRARKGH